MAAIFTGAVSKAALIEKCKAVFLAAGDFALVVRHSLYIIKSDLKY